MNKPSPIIVKFPDFTGVRCNMMPFIQGDPESVPGEYRQYADVIEATAIQPGQIGHLTIDETVVGAGQTQRGYNQFGRNVHVEVGRLSYETFGRWGRWGMGNSTILDLNTGVVIANSVAGTCRVWPGVIEARPTQNGGLDEYINEYPEETGTLLGAGELFRMGVLTPHESVAQAEGGPRQFFRLVGSGVVGRETYFTRNPLL